MPKFLFAYHGGRKPETQQEGDAIMARWTEWFDKLGDNVVDPGAPVAASHTVTANGATANGGANPVSGYSIIIAKDYDAAKAIAKECPILDDGSVEVAEIVEMQV